MKKYPIEGILLKIKYLAKTKPMIQSFLEENQCLGEAAVSVCA